MTTSTILSDNGASSGSSGLKTVGGNDGTLVIQTTTAGGTATTAMTLGTDQSVTFAQEANLPNTFGFKNRLINGAMMIDQRNAGAAVSPMSGGYGVDRWKGSYLGGGTGRFSAQQSSTAPSGFINSWLITVTTADSSPSSAYGYEVQQSIEGSNFYDFAWGTASASPATLSFWVRSSVTGTFPITLNNSDSSRLFGATYTINSANTWEYKTVAISGDTTGTWLTTTGIGVNVNFGFGGGSSRTISTGWQAGSGSTPTNVTGCTQLIATNGATFYITGVQLEKGSTATSFDYRPYGTELQLCQRYYEQTTRWVSGVGSVLGTTQYATFTWKVTKRASPTISGSPTYGSAILTNTDYVLVTRSNDPPDWNSVSISAEL